MGKRKFVIEFEVDEKDLEEWVEAEKRELGEAGEDAELLEWNAVDLVGSNWATGEGPYPRFTRIEEVK